MSCFVLMCYAHGYGKFGNCQTLGYIVIYHCDIFVAVVINFISINLS